MENLHPDILESLSEYDLPDLIDALIRLHGRDAIATLLQSQQEDHQ